MELIDLKLVAPKFKKNDKVTFIEFNKKKVGFIEAMNQNNKVEYKNSSYAVTGNGWYYSVRVDGTLYQGIDEKRLSIYNIQDDWIEKLREKGITFDQSKLELDSVVYENSPSLMKWQYENTWQLHPKPDEVIKVTFKKKTLN